MDDSEYEEMERLVKEFQVSDMLGYCALHACHSPHSVTLVFSGGRTAISICHHCPDTSKVS